MKIYIGKNKKESKEITLKEVICLMLKIKDAEIEPDRFSDDSASWISILQRNKDKGIDIVLEFDPENDNSIVKLSAFESKYILDDENAKKIV